ncbi:MAG: gamma-glutamylcyclotransferase family protein [Pseudomonadota bacterium]
MPTIHYVAYGSNLHPTRMTERVPSARVLGVIVLPGYLLAFNKRSTDKSAKCMLYSQQTQPSQAYGVLYEFNSNEKKLLDNAEGLGNGYYEQQVNVPLNGIDYIAYIYMANSSHIDTSLPPYTWYKNLVLAGAVYHNFPAEYVQYIMDIASLEDFDIDRREKNNELLRQIGWEFI